MRIILAVLTLVTVFNLNLAASWQLDLESGQVSVGYNDVQIPGDSGSRISLKNDLKADSKIFYRIRATNSCYRAG